MKKSRKRSLAAKRGWKTRRANAKRRSLAAKKGWRTRRAKRLKLVSPEKQFPIRESAPIPEEFLEFEDMFFESFDSDEEAEY